MIEKYAIFWRNDDSGETGRTEESELKFNDLKVEVDRLNQELPDVDHWISNASFDFEHAKKMRLYPSESKQSAPRKELNDFLDDFLFNL